MLFGLIEDRAVPSRQGDWMDLQKSQTPRRSVLTLAAGLALLLSPVHAANTTVPAADSGQRLILFAPAGPVLMRVDVKTGEHPAADVRQAYATELLERLDVDKSGKLEASEWTGIPMVGDLSITPDKYAHEGLLDLAGLTELLNARLGPTFKVTVKPQRLDQTVRLVDLLDRDGDGIVSLEEVVHSAAAMRALDLDDDEMLSVAELQPYPASIRQARAQERADDPQVALIVALDSPDDVDAAIKRIGSSYFRPGETAVELDRCGFRKAATGFDKDRSGGLDSAELTEWLKEGEPDISMTVSLPDRGLARVNSEFVRSRRIAAAEGASPRKWQVVLDGVELQADALNNRALQVDFIRLTGIRFLQSDADDNGYLSEGEFGGLQLGAPFTAVDSNGDGMVMRDEVDAYTKQLGQLTQTQIVLTISDDVKSLFQLMDGDDNRRLSTRELRTVGERLAGHDKNSNGRFDSGDFLSKYRLSFAFGIPAGMIDQRSPQSTMAMGARAPRMQKIGPVWFQKMDRNRDLDISWREFLGPRSAFDSLDKNHDGLIDKTEAESQ
jgi:Ca2+-binding EF-hand superfamily protein